MRTCACVLCGRGSRNFSSCSAEDFEKLTLNKGGSCLLNVPKPDETYSVPYCGNKLVDAGEECDCGSPKVCGGCLTGAGGRTVHGGGAVAAHSQHFCFQECESDPCCEPGTCRLRYGAQCAYGDCCKNCKVGDSDVIFESVPRWLGKGERRPSQCFCGRELCTCVAPTRASDRSLFGALCVRCSVRVCCKVCIFRSFLMRFLPPLSV